LAARTVENRQQLERLRLSPLVFDWLIQLLLFGPGWFHLKKCKVVQKLQQNFLFDQPILGIVS
jgi:hypothetical protein